MYYFAQTNAGYGCAGYGETDAYNSCQVISSDKEGLADTGTFILGAAGLSILLIIATVVVIFCRKRETKV